MKYNNLFGKEKCWDERTANAAWRGVDLLCCQEEVMALFPVEMGTAEEREWMDYCDLPDILPRMISSNFPSIGFGR